jgi:hypothetical protein
VATIDSHYVGIPLLVGVSNAVHHFSAKLTQLHLYPKNISIYGNYKRHYKLSAVYPPHCTILSKLANYISIVGVHISSVILHECSANSEPNKIICSCVNLKTVTLIIKCFLIKLLAYLFDTGCLYNQLYIDTCIR